MSLDVAVPALIGIACLGWASGMLTFRRSSRWCPECGDTLGCLRCARMVRTPPATNRKGHRSTSGELSDRACRKMTVSGAGAGRAPGNGSNAGPAAIEKPARPGVARPERTAHRA
jgi:hypothetical protein